MIIRHVYRKMGAQVWVLMYVVLFYAEPSLAAKMGVLKSYGTPSGFREVSKKAAEALDIKAPYLTDADEGESTEMWALDSALSFEQCGERVFRWLHENGFKVDSGQCWFEGNQQCEFTANGARGDSVKLNLAGGKGEIKRQLLIIYLSSSRNSDVPKDNLGQ